MNDSAIGIYQEKDLVGMLPHLVEAALLWSKLCADEVAKNGDRGSCVIGAGIAIWFKGPRKRNEEERIVIPTPYTSLQGSFTWETSVDQVVKFLAQKGITAHYAPGRLD